MKSVNKMKKILLYGIPVIVLLTGYFLFNTSWSSNEYSSAQTTIHQTNSDTTMADDKTYKVEKSEEEWREDLTSDEYRILREKGTELPYINKYYKTEKEGIYTCAACGQKIFSSETKYHSGSGWPAFYAPFDKDAIDTKADNSMFMTRTEVLCSRCGSHLGHVFEDGPEPTGLRYCINSVAMNLIEKN
jgi:peptide-methionine (R)-S-oxide reductase